MQKKSFLFCLLLIFSFLVSYASVVRMEISNGWNFCQARLNLWHPAVVPGVVHLDLMRNKIIDDPYLGLNERGVQWVDKEDWIYETSFDLSDSILHKENIYMVFEGLDTYADIYLNDSKILVADNMFREWNIDVKTILKQHNRLKVYFHSPLKIDIPKWDVLPFKYEAVNDQSENGGIFNKKVSVFARKAGYHYGWDWGPRLVTSGIWKPVYIEAWDGMKITDVFFKQQEVTTKRADLVGEIDLFSSSDIENATLIIQDKNSLIQYGKISSRLSKGTNKIKVPFTIDNPELWWCNGLGKPFLYDFEIIISNNNRIHDSVCKRIGLRSLRVINKPDKYGESFYIELNGIPVFMKGANYIPQDNFLPRVTIEQYRRTILDAVNVNMNMLRVWGGGIYEKDVFYQMCDEYGILVWQDFMFACSLYPVDDMMAENIRQEAIDNLRRLRNHSCIALWCGNNECNEAWYTWGWRDRYFKKTEVGGKVWEQYTRLYNKILPEVVSKFSPGTFYWPSSPFSRHGAPSKENIGDRHFWDVWGGEKSIDTYLTARSRFFSEYGFQSFPDIETIKRYAPNKSDWNIYSEVMMSHQRAGINANKKIETYLIDEFGKPHDFQSFLYMNQLLQGDAIKMAIEAHRRDMPFCMGTLFWQHNDCWPVASWSSRDYYGRWKAQHYFVRDAFRDILVSPCLKAGNLDIYVVSDRLNKAHSQLKISFMKFSGEVVASFEKDVVIESNSSKKYFSVDLEELLKDLDTRNIFVFLELITDEGDTYSNVHFFNRQKDLDYPTVTIHKEIKIIEGGYELSLISEKFARGVYVSLPGNNCVLSNNFMDLLPKKLVRLNVYTDLPIEDFEKTIRIVTLNNL